jgi:hypothetical protein
VAAKIEDKGAAARSRSHSSVGAYGSFWPLELTLNHIGSHLLPLGGQLSTKDPYHNEGANNTYC